MRMLEAVPARIVGGSAKPEVRPLVDDRDAPRQEVRDEPSGRPVGQGEEDGVNVDGELTLEEKVGRREVGVDAAHGITTPLATGEPDELDMWMRGKQPDQLPADVAGRPDDPDADRRLAGAPAGGWVNGRIEVGRVLPLDA